MKSWSSCGNVRNSCFGLQMMWIDQVWFPVASIDLESFQSSMSNECFCFQWVILPWHLLGLGIFPSFWRTHGRYRHWQRLEAAEAQLAEKDQQVQGLLPSSHPRWIEIDLEDESGYDGATQWRYSHAT